LVGSAYDAAVAATKNYFDEKDAKERKDFFDKFTPDAFVKAQEKYNPKTQTTAVSGAPKSPALPLDTAAYAVTPDTLAQI
jgi:hypothetical protein